MSGLPSTTELWSVRMHAAAQQREGARHLSGAERLVHESQLDAVVQEMLTRARNRYPDLVQLTVERVPDGACHHIPCLPVHTINTPCPESAALVAIELLTEAGIASFIARAALTALQTGLGSGGAGLRGASLWDRESGSRLELNPERGVRTSRFDYSDIGVIEAALVTHGITHFRTREALAVATKTLWAGVVADLCWSDEPDYTTGYVAAPHIGYVRFPGFKPDGACGGRIFFLDQGRTDLEACIRRLEREYVLIDPPIHVTAPTSAAGFRKHG